MPDVISKLPLLTNETMVEISNWTSDRFITLTMPTQRRGPETRQNVIRFKNLFQQLTANLEGEFQQAISQLEAKLHDAEFWQHQRRGLAFVAGREQSCWLATEQSLPESIDVDEHPNLSTLMVGVSSLDHSPVLLLTWESADLRLLEHDSLSCDSVGDFPFHINDLVTPRDPEEQLQYSSHQAPGGNKAVMYHGHGEGESKVEADQHQFFKRVCDAAHSEIGSDSAHLSLVATDKVAGHFRKVTQQVNFIHVAGSPDGLSETDVSGRVLESLRECRKQEHQDLEEEFAAATSADRVMMDEEPIPTASESGRIEKLIFARLPVERTGADLRKINHCLAHTLRNGGHVMCLEAGQLPGNARQLVAFLRF